MPLRAKGGLACSSLGIPLWPLVALASLVSSVSCQQEQHSGGRPRKFISYYGHREVQEGENFIIYCFADPKAKISWTKDGSPLRHWSAWQGYSVSEYNAQDFKVSRLEVQAADADFSGGYSCSSESLAKHFVQVTALQDSTGAQAPCHVLDGEELFPDNDRFLAVGRTLEIRRACEEDAGAYGCSRARSAMNDSAGMAHVLQLVTPVRLEPLEGAVYAPLGARVNLECRAYARPDPQITWLFGDRSRVSSPLLSVDNVSVSHSGTYRCSASHERCARLVAESVVTVNVFESTIRTNEGFPGSGITLTPGADFLRLICDYPADRSAKIVWLKGNATVLSGDKYVYKDQSLVINKPERSDVGNYSCVALGRVVNETAVIVVGLKVAIRTSQSKRFKEGHDGFLSCKIDGYPTPTIRWYRNGHLLNAFRSSKFKYGGKRADDYGTLVIRRLGKRDEATFACLVDNGHSQDRAFFAVAVSVPPSPLIPFFVICAEVALLTVIAFLFEHRVRSLWMTNRRTTSPKRVRSPDRAVGRKQKSCTESDILRFISCLETSGDLNLDDLHVLQPDEKPQAKDLDVALKYKPLKTALFSRGKADAAAEPHVEFRPSEHIVKADIEPLNELEALDKALAERKEGRTEEEGPPEEDNVYPRKKARKKKSRRASRKSRLSEDEPFSVTAQEGSTTQAAELEKPFLTAAHKQRAPKFSKVVEEPLPTDAQSTVSKVDNILPGTAQEQEEVPQFSKMKADFLPNTSQTKEQVPQFASVEKRDFPSTAHEWETVPQFSEVSTADLPQSRKVKAKADQAAQEPPAELAISRAKVKKKKMPKEPFTVPPAEESEDAELGPFLQETEIPILLAKGSVFNQEKDVNKKVTERKLASETCSISSLDDFTYRKDSVSSQIAGSEVLTDTMECKPAIHKAESDGTGSFLFEEEPCNWKHTERRIVEYPETQAVAVAGDVSPSGHEGALPGMPAAEGDAFATSRGIGFTSGTKHEDGSLRNLKRKGKKRKGWHKSKNEDELSPEAPEEKPFFFGVHASAGMNQNILPVPLSQQRDEAEKAGFVGYAEDTMVEGRLKDQTKPPGDTKRGSMTWREETAGFPAIAQEPVLPTKESIHSHPYLETARPLPIQEPIPFPTALEGNLLPCMPEAGPIFPHRHQINPVVKKRERKHFIIEPESYIGIDSPPAPPSPEEVRVRSRRQSCASAVSGRSRRHSFIEPSVVTRVPFPLRRKSDRSLENGAEKELAKESAKPVGKAEEPETEESFIPPTVQEKAPASSMSDKAAEKRGLPRPQKAHKIIEDTRPAADVGTTVSPRLTVPLETHVEPPTHSSKDGDLAANLLPTSTPEVNVHDDLARSKKGKIDSAERHTPKWKPGKSPQSADGVEKVPEHDNAAERSSATTSPPRLVKTHKVEQHQEADARVLRQPKKDKVPAKASTLLSTPDMTKSILHQGTPLKSAEAEGTIPVEEPPEKVAPGSAASRMLPILSSRRTSQHKDEPVPTVYPSASTPAKRIWSPPAPKGHVVSDVARPEGVTSVHQRVPTDERSPTRTRREMSDHPPGMINGMLGDTTVSETLVTGVVPDSSAEGEERRLVEVEVRPLVSKLESTSADDEHDPIEEQITLYEGLQVPYYQPTPSSSEGEYEPPMASDLFNSTASPESDWTQNPDNYYFLSIPPFEFAIPSSQIDGPEGGSQLGTALKQPARDGKRKRGSSTKRRKHHIHKHKQGGRTTSGSFTPSSELEPEGDGSSQSTADGSGQTNTDGPGQASVDGAAPSTSQHEPSRREHETASPNRRVKQDKSKTGHKEK
ncbi:hypothetical protein HPB49_015736 [Dermacentor silvarum]|uniref:Uncharacterized protein n=1 Tax=Dermacentor silvarum TaxID=543639 RepID=A0ACB8CXX8_DERSI|nr:hypothetical protein HPB49_015736 [Dermacentor silvarum]